MDQPWKVQLEADLAGERTAPAASSDPPLSPLSLPHLSRLPGGLTLPSELQGHGWEMLGALLSHYAADPKDPSVFPLDLEEKPATLLCTVAAHMRTHATPWESKAHTAWLCTHRCGGERRSDCYSILDCDAEGSASSGAIAAAVFREAASLRHHRHAATQRIVFRR